MEFLKRYWTQIKAQLEGLTVSQKWAISVTLVLGLLLAGFVVMLAGQQQTVPISGFTSGQAGQVLSRLRAAGIDAERQNGQIVVPADQEERAISMLVQDDLLSADTSKAFKDLIDRQSPWQTDKQNEQAYLLAKQRVLSQVIGKMKGVNNASVLVSMPRNQGFGTTHVEPSASVTVWMEGGQRVKDGMVDSVARLVAGSVAEMPPQSVSVTDGNFGRTRTVKDADAVLPTETMELVHKLENYHQRKIDNVLSYIKGAIVAVNVRIGDVAKQQEVEYNYSETEPLESEQDKEIVRQETGEGGAPGARANTGTTIQGGQSAGMEEQITESSAEYREKPLVLERHTTRTGHQVQSVNVTVNVPRKYFVDIYRAQNPDGADNPTDADLQPIMDQHLQQIQQQVEPLILAEGEGVVRAHMIPDETVMPAVAGSTPSGGVQGLLVSNWIKPVGIALLALVSLVLMLSMVRKATKQEELPSVEELAGVPASLDAEEETVGDAEDTEAPMAGVELNEDEIKTRKMAEQLNEMIKDNPAEAGQLFKRWVRKEG